MGQNLVRPPLAPPKRCRVLSKTGSKYAITYRISRSDRLYTYVRGDDVLKAYRKQDDPLTEEGKRAVLAAVEGFDRRIEAAHRGEDGFSFLKTTHLRLYYRRLRAWHFVLLLEDLDTGRAEFLEDAELNILLHLADRDAPMEVHPLYRDACRHGDLRLRYEIELHYGSIGADGMAYLGQAEEEPLLPVVTDDREFYMKPEDIPFGVFCRSGYSILHRPVLALGLYGGCSRRVYTISPHERKIVDAAPANAQTCTFKEFLAATRRTDSRVTSVRTGSSE